ncbi:MAG: hypothetical protein L7F78_15950, partial [Syntrophales bacterium LBB04]|nr:hypothetical protein [Syntrophales bacterium LBB04]
GSRKEVKNIQMKGMSIRRDPNTTRVVRVPEMDFIFILGKESCIGFIGSTESATGQKIRNPNVGRSILQDQSETNSKIK